MGNNNMKDAAAAISSSSSSSSSLSSSSPPPFINIRPDIISYNTALNAVTMTMTDVASSNNSDESSTSSSNSRWDVLMKLRRRMDKQDGIKPTVVTYGIMISACEKWGKWQQAMALLEEMKKKRVMANTVAYNAAISA